MTTYDRIKNLCISNNLTISGLEKILGYSNGSISKKKNGCTLSSKRLTEVANYFNVSMDYLLNGKINNATNNETANIAQKIIDNPELKALFDMSVDASTEDIKAITNMMVTLRNKEKERNKSYIELPVAARTGNNKITKISEEDYIKIKDILSNIEQ